MTTTGAPNHLAEPEQIGDLINHDESIAEEVRGPIRPIPGGCRESERSGKRQDHEPPFRQK